MEKIFTVPITPVEKPTRMFVMQAHDLAQYGLDGDLWGLVAVQDEDLVGFTAMRKDESDKPYQTSPGAPVRIILYPDNTFEVL